MFREEDRTFLLLCSYLLPESIGSIMDGYDLNDEYDKHPATHKCREFLEQELRKNSILVQFFGARLETEDLRTLLSPITEYYAKTASCYADIYSIDIYKKEGGTNQPIVLWQNDVYLGHIYGSVRGSFVEFIGIRESIRCTLEKLYNHNAAYRGIAFSLLDACKAYGKSTGATKITLACPIGTMIEISKKYGFVNDELVI